MEAEDYFCARGAFDAKALGADGDAAIGADFEGSSEAPNIMPPRAAWGWAQDGPAFFGGTFPGLLWGHAQFSMSFVDVAVESQGIDVSVGGFDLSDLFAGEIGWESPLPELVFALDFPLGLGCWCIKEANIVKLEGPAELGQCVGIL